MVAWRLSYIALSDDPIWDLIECHDLSFLFRDKRKVFCLEQQIKELEWKQLEASQWMREWRDQEESWLVVIIAEGEMEPTFIISWRIFPVDARSLSSPESLHDDPVIVLQLRVPVQQHDGDQEEAVDQGQHQPYLTNLKK